MTRGGDMKSFFRQQKAHTATKPTGGVSKKTAAAAAAHHHQKAAPALQVHPATGNSPDPDRWFAFAAPPLTDSFDSRSDSPSRHRRSRAPGGRGGAGARGPGVRHGHALRALPRPHPRPAPPPRRRARARPAAGAPRALHQRPALPLGGPRLVSRRRWALRPSSRFASIFDSSTNLCY